MVDTEITNLVNLVVLAVGAGDIPKQLVDRELLVKVTLVVLDILYKKQVAVVVELAQLVLMLVRLLAVMVVQEQRLVLVDPQ